MMRYKDIMKICELLQDPAGCLVITPSIQNVGRFGFSRFIVFAKHLGISYVYIHSKIYESKNIKTTYILERME